MKLFNPYNKFFGCQLPNCLLTYKGLKLVEKVVWARLAQFMGKNRSCYPKQKTIAIELALTEKTVRDALHGLEQKGFLKVVIPTPEEKAQHRTNEYFFVKHYIFDEDDEVSEHEESDRKKLPVESTKSDRYFLPNPTGKKGQIRPVEITAPIEEIQKKRIIEENQQGVVKKKKSSKIDTFKIDELYLGQFPKTYIENEEFNTLWISYVTMRKKKKAIITERAVELIVADMRKYYKRDIQGIIEVIEDSIKNGWTGLFFKESFEKKQRKQYPQQKGFNPNYYSKKDKSEEPTNLSKVDMCITNTKGLPK